MTDKAEEQGMKPKMAASIGPIAGLIGLIASLVLAPYVELHMAHFWLWILVFGLITFVAPFLVMCFSEGPNHWDKENAGRGDSWPR